MFKQSLHHQTSLIHTVEIGKQGRSLIKITHKGVKVCWVHLLVQKNGHIVLPDIDSIEWFYTMFWFELKTRNNFQIFPETSSSRANSKNQTSPAFPQNGCPRKLPPSGTTWLFLDLRNLETKHQRHFSINI
jgi:hypothetical protein